LPDGFKNKVRAVWTNQPTHYGVAQKQQRQGNLCQRGRRATTTLIADVIFMSEKWALVAVLCRAGIWQHVGYMHMGFFALFLP